MPKKTEPNNFARVFGYSVVSGFLESLIVILANGALFLVALFYKPDALPYVLGFFGICSFRLIVKMFKKG